MARATVNVDQESESMTGGSYVRNFSLIKIPVLHSFWHGLDIPMLEASPVDAIAGGAPPNAPKDIVLTPFQSQENFATFVHEYLHYLHNFSTAAGIYDLVTQFKIARLFRETVGASGTSVGSAALKEDKQRQLAALLRWRQHLVGDKRPAGHLHVHRREVKIRFVAVKREWNQYMVDGAAVNGEDVRVQIEISSQSADPDLAEMELGVICLTEAIAWEVDQAVLGKPLEDSEPEFNLAVPYRVVRAVLEHFFGEAPKGTDVIKVSLLALQSSDPGASLIDLASQIAHLKSLGHDLDVAIGHCTSTMTSELGSKLDPFLNQMLIPELRAFEEIASIKIAAELLRSSASAYVSKRVSEPFFETSFLENGYNKQALFALMGSIPPCPIIETADCARSANLYTFGLDAATVQSLGVFQGFMQFMAIHTSRTGFIETPGSVGAKCAFFSVCEAGFPETQPDICTTAPWRSFSERTAAGPCWYALGVASARGRVDGTGAAVAEGRAADD